MHVYCVYIWNEIPSLYRRIRCDICFHLFVILLWMVARSECTSNDLCLYYLRYQRYLFDMEIQFASTVHTVTCCIIVDRFDWNRKKFILRAYSGNTLFKEIPYTISINSSTVCRRQFLIYLWEKRNTNRLLLTWNHWNWMNWVAGISNLFRFYSGHIPTFVWAKSFDWIGAHQRTYAIVAFLSIEYTNIRPECTCSFAESHKMKDKMHFASIRI